jgi:hypothetical protein
MTWLSVMAGALVLASTLGRGVISYFMMRLFFKNRRDDDQFDVAYGRLNLGIRPRGQPEFLRPTEPAIDRPDEVPKQVDPSNIPKQLDPGGST